MAFICAPTVDTTNDPSNSAIITSAEVTSEKPTTTSTTEATISTTTKSTTTEKPTTTTNQTTTTQSKQSQERDYVLNTNSMKFHYPYCSSVDKIKSYNRKDYHGTREDLIAKGYDPCGNCHP